MIVYENILERSEVMYGPTLYPFQCFITFETLQCHSTSCRPT